ncbi:MAG TPA: sugar phosphate nucleotidyltransferase [Sulfuricaulis sp.]|nr:sugar phosphate nucleotidyltransferase [Sulfuricaulis sp.]
MEAVILAGGLGSRLRDEVPDLPKPMAPINGRPFLEYLLDYWGSQGVDRFVLSVGYRSEIIETHFGSAYKGIEIDYAVETQPRGTGGGLLLALEHLHQPAPFLIVNGDTFFQVDLIRMRQHHDQAHADVTIALRQLEKNNRYAGVAVDVNGRITSFDSNARLAGPALINGGVYLARRAAFKDFSSAPISGVISVEDRMFPEMLAAGRLLYGFSARGKFVDIGIPEDYRRAAEIMSNI